nr:immunoglobulin heavy chain junction region [Macaca mulatta]MOW76407.1 immunoglobulin heavy chain junction region [Macaca mulatta]MOW77173.1 immunoglobulin heavy chain junction region [Macaca mulatta]MOW77492.1 immunoglobulin heavy chain junction region [Macaca mulatta]MOW77576.1 immunoglobulin heavy chain junction region [Macaca mulatta]
CARYSGAAAYYFDYW